MMPFHWEYCSRELDVSRKKVVEVTKLLNVACTYYLTVGSPFFLCLPKPKTCYVPVSDVFSRHETTVLCPRVGLKIHLTFKAVGQSSFITSDLCLLQHITAVLLLLEAVFPGGLLATVGVGILFLVDYEQVSSCSTSFFFFILFGIVPAGLVELIDPDWRHKVRVLERIRLTLTQCRPAGSF